jgi:U3 small nucleolar RNA-associated protein 10
LQKLEHGLVASLTLDRKVEVCNLLLDAGSKDADVVRIHLRLSLYHTDFVIQYLCCKKLLAALLHEIPLIVRLLVATRPEANTSPRASKRPKLSECVPFKNHRLL